MAKNSIRDYSATNSSNTDIQSIDISEGCSPAGINNAIREVMADLKDVSTGAVALESPAADSLSVTGDLTVDTNTLYVDSTNNRVGVGTTSPNYALHITRPSGTATSVNLEQTGVYSWEVGMPASGAALAFKGSGTERMRIDSSGNLLVGTTSAASNSDDGVTIGGSGFLYITRDNDIPMFLNRNTSDGAVAYFRRSGTTVGSISVTTSSTAYNTSSDYRLKENVVADWDATTRLKQLNPVRFNFIADPDTTVDGFIAHEVQDIVPEAISGTHNEVDDEGNPVYQGIDQSKLVPLLVKTIQELEARITALEAN